MPDITSTRPAGAQDIEAAWGQEVHDSIEGIQAGTVTLVASAADLTNAVAVTFPRAFTAAPIVIVSVAPSTGGANWNVSATAVSATGATFQAREVRAVAGSQNVVCHWIAIGTPA